MENGRKWWFAWMKNGSTRIFGTGKDEVEAWKDITSKGESMGLVEQKIYGPYEYFEQAWHAKTEPPKREA